MEALSSQSAIPKSCKISLIHSSFSSSFSHVDSTLSSLISISEWNSLSCPSSDCLGYTFSIVSNLSPSPQPLTFLVHPHSTTRFTNLQTSYPPSLPIIYKSNFLSQTVKVVYIPIPSCIFPHPIFQPYQTISIL